MEPTEEEVLSTPTPAPTATPSQLDFVVEDITQRVGIDDLTILGLNGEDLVNLLISIFIVLLGVALGELFMNGLLWLVRRTPPKFDDQLVELLDKQLKWLIPGFYVTQSVKERPTKGKTRLFKPIFHHFVRQNCHLMSHG